MFQNGPGEGYHAAKADALALDPTLKCRRVGREYAVMKGDRCLGTGRIARVAWNEALDTLKTGKAPWLRT